jgi:membrane fusion protein (multidrug efflux system)
VVQFQSVEIDTDLPGRTTAFRVAQIVPQVNGVILKRMFVEGSDVKAGQQLYQIDPAPFEATLASGLATLAKAEATAVSARLLAQRYKPLADAEAISRQTYDNAVATLGEDEADIASAKATVESARINLVYTKVLSPIAGRSGRSSVTEGALVAANQSTALVTIQQLDPIYVDVNQSSTLLLRLKRELANGKLHKTGANQAEVSLKLEDETAFPQKGVLKFSEVSVDVGTGAITLRAEYRNPDDTLLPGMFVHEQIIEGTDDRALMVPQQGVTHDQRGLPTAMVVSAESKVEIRTLKTDRAIGDQWLVTDGLAAGDKVIVQGLQGIKPGVQVTAKEISQAALRDGADPSAPASGAPAGTGSKPGSSDQKAPAQKNASGNAT